MNKLLIICAVLSITSCVHRDPGNVLRFDAYRALWDSMGIYPDKDWRHWKSGKMPANTIRYKNHTQER